MIHEIQPPLRIDHKPKMSALDQTEEMIFKILNEHHSSVIIAYVSICDITE